MRNLYIDFDGVILDTINTTYKIMEELGVDRENEFDKVAFYKTLNWEQIIKITPVINDSIKCIQKVIESERFDIAILTHVHSLEEVVEKVKFIRSCFNDITVIPVPKAISKTRMVRAKDAILVDDYSGNLREWEEAGGIGVRFSTILESKGFTVIDHLDQLLDINF